MVLKLEMALNCSLLEAGKASLVATPPRQHRQGSAAKTDSFGANHREVQRKFCPIFPLLLPKKCLSKNPSPLKIELTRERAVSPKVLEFLHSIFTLNSHYSLVSISNLSINYNIVYVLVLSFILHHSAPRKEK